MLKFVKANKMFSAVVAGSVALVLLFAYGLAVRDVFAVILGSAMLVCAIACSFGSMVKAAFFK